MRRVVLRATAVGVLTGLLLLGLGFLCATAPVRHSRFGQRLERRLPVAWSRAALLAGSPFEQMDAIECLRRVGTPAAMSALCEAVQSRRVSPRDPACIAVVRVAQSTASKDVRALAIRRVAGLTASGDADLRRPAQRTLRDMAQLPGLSDHPEVRRALLRGLEDPDLECRRFAATTVRKLWHINREMDPGLAGALQARLLGPSPGPVPSGRRPPPDSWVAELGRGLTRSSFHQRLSLLVELWEWGTPRSRQLVRGYLARHPLAEAHP